MVAYTSKSKKRKTCSRLDCHELEISVVVASALMRFGSVQLVNQKNANTVMEILYIYIYIYTHISFLLLVCSKFLPSILFPVMIVLVANITHIVKE